MLIRDNVTSEKKSPQIFVKMDICPSIVPLTIGISIIKASIIDVGSIIL